MRKAEPIVSAWIEESEKYPDGGKELKDAMGKRVIEIKKQSALEKKQCAPKYRELFFWDGIKSQEDFEKKYAEIKKEYRDGTFFLKRIGRYREIDPELAMVLLYLREECIVDYEIKTAPEFMLLDMALASHFQFQRINEDINDIMANIEWDVFVLDAPRFDKNEYEDKNGRKNDKLRAEELAHKLREVLQPSLDQYNRMFIRNLKAIRDLKRGNIQLNIGNIGQMNFGDKQVNIKK